MTRGDDLFPVGTPPRSCVVCGQYERGRGFRMGFAKAAHGRKHVRDGTAREILRHGVYNFVITDAGVIAAEKLLNSDRCKTCGLALPTHTKDCMQAYMERTLAANSRARRRT